MFTTAPFAPCVTALTKSVSPSTSPSFKSTSTVIAVSSSVEAKSSAATGGSFTAFTAMVTVVRLESARPSFARYVKLSVPS